MLLKHLQSDREMIGSPAGKRLYMGISTLLQYFFPLQFGHLSGNDSGTLREGTQIPLLKRPAERSAYEGLLSKERHQVFLLQYFISSLHQSKTCLRKHTLDRGVECDYASPSSQLQLPSLSRVKLNIPKSLLKLQSKVFSSSHFWFLSLKCYLSGTFA